MRAPFSRPLPGNPREKAVVVLVVMLRRRNGGWQKERCWEAFVVLWRKGDECRLWLLFGGMFFSCHPVDFFCLCYECGTVAVVLRWGFDRDRGGGEGRRGGKFSFLEGKYLFLGVYFHVYLHVPYSISRLWMMNVNFHTGPTTTNKKVRSSGIVVLHSYETR